MNIKKELARIQKELKAPKNQQNKFGGYKYRSCEDILEAVKPHLGENTVVISDDIVLIGERYYVKATAVFSNGEESIPVSAFAREAETKKGMDESQITGAASSYARKYALNGLFLIDDTKDADTQDNAKNDSVSNKQDIIFENAKSRIAELKTAESLDAAISKIDEIKISDKKQEELKDIILMKKQKIKETVDMERKLKESL